MILKTDEVHQQVEQLFLDITSPLEVLSWWSATRIIEKSDEEKYITYKESWNFRSFFPPKQNKVNWNYATNTQLMNQYLSNNTFQFSILNTKDWYLYIRLKNKTDAWVFIFRYGSNKNWYTVSWDLDKNKSLINSETELLYKLDNIPYIRFYDKKSDTYNWLSQMKPWTNRRNDYSLGITSLTILTSYTYPYFVYRRLTY